MAGTTIIVIILIPIAFQVFLLAIKQEKRHQELKEILKNLDDKLKK